MIHARAPGKVVALGEYAVLDGAPAVVLAVDRYVDVTLEAGTERRCRLTTHAAETSDYRFAPGERSGVGLVDLVTAAAGASLGWTATIDSRALHLGGQKLGLGSSAAVLCAFAGAYGAFVAGEAGKIAAPPGLAGLIELHRAFQGGKGSGLDVAASYTGGAITFSLGPGGVPQVGSVRLPNSVGFAGIFAGRSASTPDLVAHYRAWRRDRPGAAEQWLRRLTALAEAGCAALRGDDAAAWVEAFTAYGRGLQDLGEAIGAEVVTAEHRQIGDEARRQGVAYKVSGAGGGDLGLACAAETEVLAAFTKRVTDRGFRVINISLAEHGLKVERRLAGTNA